MSGNGLKTIKMCLKLEPTPQRRPRFSSRGKFTSTYKDKTQLLNEDDLKQLLEEHKPNTPFDGPLKLSVLCVMPPPKSNKCEYFNVGFSSKTFMTKFKAAIDAGLRFMHIRKPDIDNLQKQIMDSMTREEFWFDDCQVCTTTMQKAYGLESKWIIHLSQMEDIWL